jgi:hypothetical protein
LQKAGKGFNSAICGLLVRRLAKFCNRIGKPVPDFSHIDKNKHDCATLMPVKREANRQNIRSCDALRNFQTFLEKLRKNQSGVLGMSVQDSRNQNLLILNRN